MEIFLDGGLFELIVAAGLGYMINYIFLRKYLLIIFSLISISASILTIFINKGELFYFLSALNVFNTGLLIVLLWRERIRLAGAALFDTARLKKIVRNRFTGKSRPRAKAL